MDPTGNLRILKKNGRRLSKKHVLDWSPRIGGAPVTKKTKLVKNALKHPEAHSSAEIQYFKLWLAHRKEKKSERKAVTSPSCFGD